MQWHAGSARIGKNVVDLLPNERLDEDLRPVEMLLLGLLSFCGCHLCISHLYQINLDAEDSSVETLDATKRSGAGIEQKAIPFALSLSPVPLPRG